MAAIRKPIPTATTPSTRPLVDVVIELRSKAAKLTALDAKLGGQLEDIAERLRRLKYFRIVSAPFAPWGTLGWSGSWKRPWRFVVIEDEDTCTDLTEMPKECQSDAVKPIAVIVERILGELQKVKVKWRT